MVMKSIPDFSCPIPAEWQSHIVLTKENEASGDVEQEGDWDHDTRNPRNWPLSKKWAAVSVVSSPWPVFTIGRSYTKASPCDMIGFSLHHRRRHCQLHDGTCFAANRNSLPYHKRHRNCPVSVYIHAFVCPQPTLVCALIGDVGEKMGEVPYHSPSAFTHCHAFLDSSHQQLVIYRLQPGLCIRAIQARSHLLPVSQYVEERFLLSGNLKVIQAVGLVVHQTPSVEASSETYSPPRIELWQWRSTPSVRLLVGLNTSWLLASL